MMKVIFYYSQKQPPEVFFEKGVLKGLLRRLDACNFITKETLARFFSCEFCQISKNTFFLQNTSGVCFCIVPKHALYFKEEVLLEGEKPTHFLCEVR